MLTWLQQNAGTLAVGAVMLLVILLILIKLLKDKRKGRSSCGCGCSHCAMRGSCHKS